MRHFLKRSLLYGSFTLALLAGALSFDAVKSDVSPSTSSIARYLRSLPSSIQPKLRGDYDYERFKLPGFYSLPSEYAVQEGDTEESIASRHGLASSWIRSVNQFKGGALPAELHFGDRNNIIEVDPEAWVSDNPAASMRVARFILQDTPFKPYTDRDPTDEDFKLMPYNPGLKKNTANLHKVFIGDFLPQAGLEQMLFVTEHGGRLQLQIGSKYSTDLGITYSETNLGSPGAVVLDYRGKPIKHIPIQKLPLTNKTEVHGMRAIAYTFDRKREFAVVTDQLGQFTEDYLINGGKYGDWRPTLEVKQSLSIFSMDDKGNPQWEIHHKVDEMSHPFEPYLPTRFATKVRVINSATGKPQFLLVYNHRLSAWPEDYRILSIDFKEREGTGFARVRIPEGIKVAEIMEFLASAPPSEITKETLRQLEKEFGQQSVNAALETQSIGRMYRTEIVDAMVKAYIKNENPLPAIAQITGTADPYILETLANDASSSSFRTINEQNQLEPVTFDILRSRGSFWGVVPHERDLVVKFNPWVPDSQITVTAGGYVGGGETSRLGLQYEVTTTADGIKAKRIEGTRVIFVDDAKVVDRMGNRVQETRESGHLDPVGTWNDFMYARRSLGVGPDISRIREGIETSKAFLEILSSQTSDEKGTSNQMDTFRGFLNFLFKDDN